MSAASPPIVGQQDFLVMKDPPAEPSPATPTRLKMNTQQQQRGGSLPSPRSRSVVSSASRTQSPHRDAEAGPSDALGVPDRGPHRRYSDAMDTNNGPAGPSHSSGPLPAYSARGNDVHGRLARLGQAQSKIRDEMQAARMRADILTKEKAALEEQLHITRDTAMRMAGVLSDSAFFTSMNRTVLKEMFDNLAVSTTPVLNRLSGELASLRGRFKLLADAEALHERFVETTARYEKAVDGWRRARERVQAVEEASAALQTRVGELEAELETKQGALTDSENRTLELDSKLKQTAASLEVESKLRAEAEAYLELEKGRSAKAEASLAELDLELKEQRLKSGLVSNNLTRTREELKKKDAVLAQERAKWSAERESHAAELLTLRQSATETMEEFERTRNELQAALSEAEDLRGLLASLRTEQQEIVAVHAKELDVFKEALEQTREQHRTQAAEWSGREAKLLLDLDALRATMEEKLATETRRLDETKTELGQKVATLTEVEMALSAEREARMREVGDFERKLDAVQKEKEELDARCLKLTWDLEEAAAHHASRIAELAAESEKLHKADSDRLDVARKAISGLQSKLEETERARLDQCKRADSLVAELGVVRQELADTTAANQNGKARIDHLESELESVSGKLSATEANFTLLEAEQAKLIGLHDEATTKLGSRVSDLSRQLLTVEKDRDDLRVKYDQLSREMEDAGARHAETIALMSREGEERHLDAVRKLEVSHSELAALKRRLEETERFAAEQRGRGEALAAEVDMLRNQLALAQAEATTSTTRLGILSTELESATGKLAIAEAASAALNVEKQAEAEAHVKAISILETRLSDFAASLSKAEGEMDDLSSTNAALVRERDELASRLSEALATLTKERDELQLEFAKTLESSRAEISVLHGRLEETERVSADQTIRAEALSAELQSVQSQLASAQTAASNSTCKITALESDLEQTRGKLVAAELASAALQVEHRDLVVDHGELKATLEYRLAELRTLNSETAQTREELASKTASLVELHLQFRSRESRIAELESETGSYKQTIADVMGAKEDLGKRLEALEQKLRDSEDTLNRVRQEAADADDNREAERNELLRRAEADTTKLRALRDEAIARFSEADAERSILRKSLASEKDLVTKLEKEVAKRDELLAKERMEDALRLEQVASALRAVEAQRDRLIEIAERQDKQATIESERREMEMRELRLKSSAMLVQLSKARDTVKSLQLQLAEARAERDMALREVQALGQSVADTVASPDLGRDTDSLLLPPKSRAPSVMTSASSNLELAYDMMLNEMEGLRGEFVAAQSRITELETRLEKA